MAEEKFLYVVYSENDYEKIDNIFLELFKKGIAIKALKDVPDGNAESLITDSVATLFVVSSSSMCDEALTSQIVIADQHNKHVIPYFLESPNEINIPNELSFKMNGSAAIPAYEYVTEADIVSRTLSEIGPYFPKEKPGKKKRHFTLVGVMSVACIIILLYNFWIKPNNREVAMDNVNKSTVLIYTLDYCPETFEDITWNYQSSGSGFFIDSSGTIATNYHVIDGAEYICIKPFNSDIDEYYYADVFITDEAVDLAVLKINTDYYTDYYLPLADNKVKTGDNIFVSGYPMGIDHTISNGIISNDCHFVAYDEYPCEYYIVTAAVSPGNSGGPTVNEDGQIIGITTAKYSDAENVNLVRPIYYLINLMQ